MTSTPVPGSGLTVFALLDDRDASARRPTSRLYTGFVRQHRCVEPSTLEAVYAAIEADQRAGLHAVLLGDYEWGAKLLQAGHRGLAADDASSLRVLMFRELTMLSREAVDAWLRDEAPACFDDDAEHQALDAAPAAIGQGATASPGVAGVAALQASVDRPAFVEAIHAIHESIRNGETYQVNYTYRLHGRAYGSPLALYRRLRARQPVAYGALITLPPDDDEAGHVDGARRVVLSCSPELFLRVDAGHATARPMKGTASRTAAPEADSETARLLAIDVKNRAENLMIVDLLRNDLGRLAVTGSVRVPALFSIEPYSTVFQMTSTVQAQLRDEVDLPTLLRAVFPCGSITGAPKHYTMGLIARLESTPRGLYTGAIGWLDAPQGGARLGDLCLSVAIRTLTLGERDGRGERPAVLGIGAGIVLDSVAADEYDECRLKARFLTGLDPGFELFETMRGHRDNGVLRLDAHLARLQASAARLGFACDLDALRRQLDKARHAWPAGQTMRIRLALAHDGRSTLAAVPLAPLPGLPPDPALDDGAVPAPPLDTSPFVRLGLAATVLPDVDPLAAHKTTRRAHYDAAVREAEADGAFDLLFFTRDGRLVEGGRSSVFLRLDGHWFTPPVADGALPGVMRAAVLADPRWAARERSLRRDDLQRAEAIVVTNALRGVLPAQLDLAAIREAAS